MNRLAAIGAGLLLLTLLVLAVLGVRSCAQEPAAPIAQVDSARDAALVGVAAEGNAITTNAMSNAAEIAATTKENEDAIRAAPGATTPVPAAANDAGLRALCMRAAYRDKPRCAAMQRLGAGAVGR